MKRDRRKKNILYGIGAKTTVSHLMLAVLIITFAAISMFALLNVYMRNYLKDQLLGFAESVGRMESGQPEFVYDQERTDYYEEITDSSIIFFNEESTEMYSLSTGRQTTFTYTYMGIGWDVDGLKIMEEVDKYMLASVLTGESIADIHSINYVMEDIIFAGAPIYDSNGKVVAGVMLMQTMDVFEEQRRVIFYMMTAITAVSLPIVIYIALRFARRLTKPLIVISEGAQKLASGNYSEWIDQQTTDEIGGIANSLNALSGRLRRTIGNLRRERDMLDLIMNGINEGIIAVDWYMHTVHCNESFLRMLEMDHKPDTVDPMTEYGSILKKCMHSNETEHIVWTDKAGNKLRAVATKLHSVEGIVIGAVCLVLDVSESMRLEQMRRDYVANVSHELRTPLTGIRGMVEPLIDGVFETDEEKMDCYNIIYKETIRLEKLIKEMLDMSRLQDGRLVVELEPVELGCVINDALTRVYQTAMDANIEIAVEAEDSPGAVMCVGNEDRIIQVLTIFLDNALSFTGAGGKITVYVSRLNNYVKIGVRDTGCGIEPKDMPYIWERFYKVDKSRMRTKGTGLGLAIAKLVVELMQGEIGVNSEPGAGADFWFKLPAIDESLES